LKRDRELDCCGVCNTIFKESEVMSEIQSVKIREFQANHKMISPNITQLEAELITQMNDDEMLTSHLEELLKQLEQVGVTRQVMISGIKANTLEVKGDMTQKASKGGSQVMASDLEITGDVKFGGNLNQES
jgi:hypothetical protein